MKRIVYTGPQESTQIRIHRPRLYIQNFQRWKKPVNVPDEYADPILKMPGFIEEGFSLKSWLQKRGNQNSYIEITRVAALGDLLQLIMALRDEDFFDGKFLIKTQERYNGIVEAYIPPIPKEWRKKDPILCLHLDGLVERDHEEGSRFVEMHRVDIFRETLGVDYTGRPRMLDKMDLSHFWKVSSWEPKKPKSYVLMNFKGSRIDNTIQPDVLLETIRILRNHLRLVLIVPDDWDLPSHPDNYPDNMDYPTLFKMVHNADRVFVTDSGLLWVSHITNTPVIGMLRKTKPPQRLSYASEGTKHLDFNLLKSEPRTKDPYVYSGDPEELAEALLKLYGNGPAKITQ